MRTRKLIEFIAMSIVALAAGLALSLPAFADTGALDISVVDQNGDPVSGAQVVARTPESLTQRSGQTDADGQVRLLGLDPSDEYVVSVSAAGYRPARNENVLVISERTLSVPVALEAGAESMEEIITYGRSTQGQLVDTTSALQSTDVTLDIMESLPTGRNYQSYLQMAPTTKPTNTEFGGNPSSKSGVNYSDVVDSRGNTAGSSSDNVYYIDGINITDNYYGTFGANFNSEIIQEQQIITGGVPAEYEGGQGLISRVITKSGGNEFSGSVNYYMQSDSLVADNKHLNDASFSTFDTAVTFGGPIVQDKLWFFTSYQRKEREEDVVDPNSQEVIRTVTRSDDYGFAKLTWQPTDSDKAIVEWFNDPRDQDGSFDTATLANRDRTFENGGSNLKLEYSHAWENLILTASYVGHESADDRISANKTSRNDVAFLDTPATNADTDLGGYGTDILWDKNKDSFKLTAEYFADTNWGNHELKAGYEQVTNEHFFNSIYSGDGSQYNSIAAVNSGATLDDYTGNTGSGSWIGEVSISNDDYARILTAMEESADYSYFLGLLDSDSSGDIDNAELGALVMDSTSGNPHGQVNAYRIRQTEQGPQNFKTEGDVFFIQDSWNITEHWTLDVGMRAEKWDHIASDGNTKVFTFDWEYAPRVSVIYDLFGDGRSKLWSFYGRYYDPIRTNMTDFAGSVTGSVLSEEVYAGNQWLNYRTRGGPGDPDGYFAPTTKTPYTDEIMVGWEHSLTENQSIAVTYTDRKTRDILEDYDLGLYTDCTSSGVGDYCLPLSYFGFDVAPQANYFISTLAGGKRDYQGVELTWRKRRSTESNWFALASWSYNDAEGNTNSDSNADFQGDVVWLDPRSPNQFGKQPGNIEHLVKLAGSYAFDNGALNGLDLGLTYFWNSGIRYSRTWAIYGRHLPERVDTAFESGGVTTRWLAPDAVGGYETSSYGTLNARAKYTMEFGPDMTAEIFLDIFNVLDDQAASRYMDLSAGGDGYDFREANAWVLPRRFYLGARVAF